MPQFDADASADARLTGSCQLVRQPD